MLVASILRSLRWRFILLGKSIRDFWIFASRIFIIYRSLLNIIYSWSNEGNRISGMEYRRGLSARVSLFIDTARQTIVPINYAPRDLFEGRPRHFNEPSPAIAVTLPLTPMHFPKRIYGFVERRKGVLKGPCLVEKFNSKSFRFKVDFFLRII